MAILDALRAADRIRERLTAVHLEQFWFRDPRIQSAARHLWNGPPEHGGLVTEPWIEGAFPAESSSETLATLVTSGRFPASLADQLQRSGAFPSDRKLYRHQLESLEVTAGNPHAGVAITAPTGAGKTEAFLLPALRQIWGRPAQRDGGISCLILYPLNALVNDQVERLDRWLAGQRREQPIRLFHFTSDTPETEKQADKQGRIATGPHRIRSRERAREEVPEILVTNYSMLEYMLIRPQDQVFFGPNLSVVVLDEAHLYAGTLAGEIAYLLRRLAQRCRIRSEQILQLASTATLGGTDEDIAAYLAELFTRPGGSISVVRGQSASRLPDIEPSDTGAGPWSTEIRQQLADLELRTLILNDQGEPELAVDEDACAQLRRALGPVTDPRTLERSMRAAASRPAIALELSLGACQPFRHLHDLLFESKQPAQSLADLSRDLWGSDQSLDRKATLALLRLGAQARPEHLEIPPLLPNRVHLLTRSPDRLGLCLNDRCSGPEDLIIHGHGCLHGLGTDVCPWCGGAVLELVRCRECGTAALAATEDRDGGPIPRLVPARAFGDGPPKYLFSLDADQGHGFGPLRVRRSGEDTLPGRLEPGPDSRLLSLIATCPVCGPASSSDSSDEATAPEGGFAVAPVAAFRSSLPLQVVAETLLQQVPPLPTALTVPLPADGRRVLCFSDSRREAALLGPQLTRGHQRQLVRCAIHSALRATGSSAETLDPEDLREEIGRLEAEQARNPTRQRILQLQIDSLRKELQIANSGVAVLRVVESLVESPLIDQVYTSADSTADEALSWDATTWERHCSAAHAKESLCAAIANELMTLSPNEASLATLGLAEITYPGVAEIELSPAVLALLPEESRDRARADATKLIAALCDQLRAHRHVTAEPHVDDRDLDLGEAPLGSAVTRENFAGKTPRAIRRRFTAKWLEHIGAARESGAALELAQRFLEALHDHLLDVAQTGRLPWLQARRSPTDATTGLRILFFELGVREPQHLYRCSSTQRVFLRSVGRSAPFHGSLGTLEGPLAASGSLSPRFGRLHREILDDSDHAVFRTGLWAEEHTAQLSADENRRIQDLFRLGARNVLSSSTTMELGIDIGGLSAVFCTNVPPNKAAYLQRAGRAGRRADGSALVVSYARARPWDSEAFSNFAALLGRELRRPVTFVGRRRIAAKHLHAWLIGEFFRRCAAQGERTGTMNAYGRIDQFLGLRLPQWIERNVGLDPDSFQKGPSVAGHLLQQAWWNRRAGWCRSCMRDVEGYPSTRAEAVALSDSSVADGFLGFLEHFAENLTLDDANTLGLLFGEALGTRDESGCAREVAAAAEAFRHTLWPWLRDWAGLLSTWFDLAASRRDSAFAIRKQMITRASSTTIEILADGGFLPRYGFPIGLLRLQVLRLDENGSGDGARVLEEDRIQLERSGLLAISEYVPGSRLVAGGRLVQSRGLLRCWTGSGEETFGERWYLARCPNDHVLPSPRRPTDGASCPICDATYLRTDPLEALIPRAGFTTAAWDKPSSSSLRVDRVGRSERLTFRVDDTEPAQSVVDFADVPGLRGRLFEGGKLFVYNPGELTDPGVHGECAPTEGLGFAICTKCGFAAVESKPGDGRIGLPKNFVDHHILTSRRKIRCWSGGEAPVLRNQYLASSQPCDMVVLDAPGRREPSNATQWNSLAIALALSGAHMLQIDERELGGLHTPVRSGDSAVIYESSAGGVGHVTSLLGRGREWLESALDRLQGSPDHDADCGRGCPECVLFFSTQFDFQQGRLDRRMARDLLQSWLGPRAP